MKLARLLAVGCLLFLPSSVAALQSATGGTSAVEIVLAIPFENAGRTPGLSWLGEGLSHLSLRRLAGASRVVLPRTEWQAAAERLGLGPSTHFTRASLVKIAHETDADYVVFGSFRVDGRQITITAQGMRLASPSLSPPIVETGSLDDLTELHARVCWRLLEFLDPLLPISRQDYLKHAQRIRLDALENFTRGLQAAGPERLRFFREATRLEPDWPEPGFALAKTYLDESNVDAALIWFSRVPPAADAGLEAGFFAGVCHLLRNDAPRAEAAFRAILERPWYPGEISAQAARRMDLPEVLNNLAIALSRQGKWSEAAALWEQVRQLAPVEPAFPFNLAVGAIRAGEFETSARALREVLRLRADDEVRALLAGALERAGRKEEASAERAACAASDCAPSEEVKALLSRAGSPSAAARLDRVSMSLDLLTWFLTGQSRESGGGNGAARDSQREARPPRLESESPESSPI